MRLRRAQIIALGMCVVFLLVTCGLALLCASSLLMAAINPELPAADLAQAAAQDRVFSTLAYLTFGRGCLGCVVPAALAALCFAVLWYRRRLEEDR
jgi:hypothetical protein